MMALNNSTKLIRIIGSIFIILSSISFLANGRIDLNSTSTHFLFIGLNFALTFFGIFCSKKLNDQKSARIFTTLSLCMLPVQLGQYGSFIYNLVNPDQINSLPSLFQFASIQMLPLTALLISLLPLLFFIPSIAFKMLNRNNEKILSFTFILNSLFILLPSRNYHIIGLLICSLFLFNIINLNKLNTINTKEANISKAILFLPIIIMIFRNCYYPNLSIFLIYISIIFNIFCFKLVPNFIENKKFKTILQSLCIPGITLFILLCANNLKNFNYLDITISWIILLTLFSLVCIFNGRNLRIFIGIIILFLMTYIFLNEPVNYQYISMILPIAYVALAIFKKEKVLFYNMLLLIIVLLFIHTSNIISMPHLISWKSLSLIGICLILMASFLEKYRIQFKEKLIKLNNYFN